MGDGMACFRCVWMDGWIYGLFGDDGFDCLFVFVMCYDVSVITNLIKSAIKPRSETTNGDQN